MFIRLLIVVSLAVGFFASISDSRSGIKQSLRYERSFDPSADKCRGAKLDEKNSVLSRDPNGVYHLIVVFSCDEET